MQLRKPPFMLPASTAVGWQPTKEDPAFVYWGDEYPYLYVLTSAKTGKVRLTVIPALNDVGADGKQTPLTAKDVLARDLTVNDGMTPLPPEPDIDPDTDPEPEPTPGFGVNPFGGQPGLRVMIVYESSDVKKLPVGQYLTIHGTKFREYLDANCVKDGYRMFDPQQIIADDSELWRTAMTRDDRKQLPWLYVGKEGTGYSGPLSVDPESNMAIIDKVSGK